jgi:circadian clock protein KaiC
MKALATTAKIPKAPTGIAGFDEMTGGGLPRGRTTLLVGGPGSGKTLFALQFLVHGARERNEPGIFVSFEETSHRVTANAESFGWKLAKLRPKHLAFLDAKPTPDLLQSGSFDLGGMLAALGAQAKATKARRIVLDALDVILDLLPDMAAKRREVYRLHEWLLASGLTAVITAKSRGDDAAYLSDGSFGFMQFMVDCSIILNHGVVLGASQRSLRLQKYRGSAFDENETPFHIGKSGFEISALHAPGPGPRSVGNARVSSGLRPLDNMLDGGYHRGASILITGFPGTAKTTLCGAFAAAACTRGERTLFASFDADSGEIVRDLSSVGIRLQRHVASGRLRMASARTDSGSAEMYLSRIKALAQAQRASCVVLDPISIWSRTTSGLSAQTVAERLIDWSKAEDITLLCTSLVDEMPSASDSGSSLQISTLADTWIHLSYLVQAGERNRALSIIKSRGTAHSNQVRELIITAKGVTLSDAYTEGGELLMGTLRWEKESAARGLEDANKVSAKLRRVQLDAEEAELTVRVNSLRVELEAKQTERALLARTAKTLAGDVPRERNQLEVLRGSDASTSAKR